MSTEIQETINRLRELDQEASPAPWNITPYWMGEGAVRWTVKDYEDSALFSLISDHRPQADLQLIAQARNAIPALLAEIERLQVAEKALKERFALIFNKWRSRRRDLIRRVQAEAWDEGYLDKETEASEEMIERGLRKRAQNPYRENKVTRQ